jgi:hypothetical protein
MIGSNIWKIELKMRDMMEKKKFAEIVFRMFLEKKFSKYFLKFYFGKNKFQKSTKFLKKIFGMFLEKNLTIFFGEKSSRVLCKFFLFFKIYKVTHKLEANKIIFQ